MQWFTCGSSIDVPPHILSKFDGVVAGYFWDLWGTDKPSVFEKAPGKIVRSQFLYGNKHRKPPEKSGCATLEDWVRKRVSNFPQVNEWVIVNEFTGDCSYSYYPGYEPENVIRYCQVVHEINPQARIIIADFKPWRLNRWLKSIKLIVEKAVYLGLPVEIGIQTHIKTVNESTILNRLPTILEVYKGLCPAHFIEASVWANNPFDKSLWLPRIWRDLIAIAQDYQVKSFCPWWLNEADKFIMPTFEIFKEGGAVYSKDWKKSVFDINRHI